MVIATAPAFESDVSPWIIGPIWLIAFLGLIVEYLLPTLLDFPHYGPGAHRVRIALLAVSAVFVGLAATTPWLAINRQVSDAQARLLRQLCDGTLDADDPLFDERSPTAGEVAAAWESLGPSRHPVRCERLHSEPPARFLPRPHEEGQPHYGKPNWYCGGLLGRNSCIEMLNDNQLKLRAYDP